MSRRTLTVVALAAAVLVTSVLGAVAQGAGSGLPKGSEPVNLDPADFTTKIDNPYWPMKPGSKWVYREAHGDGSIQQVVVRVTNKTKKLANGVVARVVRDTVTENGELVEDTVDWYAQDRAGNVWYLGEDTKEYENGKVVSTSGSWEAGRNGAQPGIVMAADPRPGLAYRQEYLAGEAEDRASIVGVNEQVDVRAGHFNRLVMTRDVNVLEPKVLEFKFYAPGVGMVLALGVSGGVKREELVRYTPGG